MEKTLGAATRRALHIYFLRWEPEFAEDAQRVSKGGRTALNSIVDIRRATQSRVNIHGARHTACHWLLLEDGNNELVSVL